MKNVLLVMVLVGGCAEETATDAEIHEVQVCDGWTSTVEECEAPCAEFGQLGSDTRCTVGGESCRAGYFKRYADRQGCCVPDVSTMSVAYVECE